MKIKKVIVKNVKSFGEETPIVFGKKLNILIGPNAGGKSNLLEIIQGCFNDLFFEDITFKENQNKENKKQKPWVFEKVNPNNQNLVKNVLDYFEGKENESQTLSITLQVESEDIQNLEVIKNLKDTLISLEEKLATSTVIKDTINSLNLELDYKKIIREEITIKIENRNLVEPSQLMSDTTLQAFYAFIRLNKVFHKLINFYNLNKNESIKFIPFVYYISPTREAINLKPEPYTVDLNPLAQISTNQLSQSGASQDTRNNLWSLVQRILAENYFLGQKSKNKDFKIMLKKHMGIDFTITQGGHMFQKNVYDIKYTRTESNHSIKLSSGEKELLNFITLTYLYKGGVFLIDEPELHLHRRWQKKLLNLLLEVSKKYNTQLVLVTHSPHFVRTEVLGNLIKIDKKGGNSYIVIPDKKELAKKTQKDIFLFITSSNNEKVFFADKVILVEGVVDRIIFEAILQITQKPDDDEVIEIVETLGKDSFKRFSSFLDTWKINHSIIADNDYLKIIGSEEVRGLYIVSAKKIKKQISKKSSKDANSLLKSLLKITKRKNPKKITLDEFNDLKELMDYIGKRNITLKDGLSDDEKSIIDTEIVVMKSKKIYILKKGEIEDYFNSGSKIDINEAIAISKKIVKKKLAIPTELKEIITSIINNKNTQTSQASRTT